VQSSPHIVHLVDDDESFRRLAAKEAAEVGVALTASASGREALDAMTETAPLLIIVDMEMPGMNGLAVGEAVRARGFGGPMVLWTASPTRDVTAAAIRSGFDRVLPKTVPLRSLLTEVGVAV